MDYKQHYYFKSKKAFLDSAKQDCKEKEDYDQCVEKQTKAFDIVFEALKEQLNKENELIALYKTWERDRTNPDDYDHY